MLLQGILESDGSYMMIGCALLFLVGIITWIWQRVQMMRIGVLGDSRADMAELRDMAFNFSKMVEEYGLIALVGQAGLRPTDAASIKLILERFRKIMTPEMRDRIDRDKKKGLTPRNRDK